MSPLCALLIFCTDPLLLYIFPLLLLLLSLISFCLSVHYTAGPLRLRTISFLFFFLIYLFIFVCIRSSVLHAGGEEGLLFVAVRGLLIAVASLAAEHGL